MSALTGKVLFLIIDERNAQDKKWGDQSNNHLFEWISILTEEVGELAMAVNETCFKTKHTKNEGGGNEVILKEAVQVAAVATAIAEAVIAKGKKGDNNA